MYISHTDVDSFAGEAAERAKRVAAYAEAVSRSGAIRPPTEHQVGPVARRVRLLDIIDPATGKAREFATPREAGLFLNCCAATIRSAIHRGFRCRDLTRVERVTDEPAMYVGNGCEMPVRWLEDPQQDRVFPSLTKAAAVAGVSPSTVHKSIHENMTVAGKTFRRAEQRPRYTSPLPMFRPKMQIVPFRWQPRTDRQLHLFAA
jgi:hypothetical protein